MLDEQDLLSWMPPGEPDFYFEVALLSKVSKKALKYSYTDTATKGFSHSQL